MRATDDAAVRQFLMVPEFMVMINIVLPCARCKAQKAIALLL